MRLTDNLLKEKLITDENLRDLMDKRKGSQKPVMELLVEMDFISEELLLKKVSELYKLPIVKISNTDVDRSVLKLVPYETARRLGVFPLKKEGPALQIAMSDPRDIMATDEMAIVAKMEIKPILCSAKEIRGALEKYYHADDQIYDLLKNAVQESRVEYISKGKSKKDADSSDMSPVIRVLDLMFSDAARSRASDIHLEAQETKLAVRYRIDGQLKNVIEIPQNMKDRMISRIKIIAGMDIAEKRKPQDGRSVLVVNEKKIDLRISVVPTMFGEKAVIRLLRQEESPAMLDNIGLDSQQSVILNEALASKQGIVLVTGPTGSGKTSTLYGVLNKLKSETKNIVTIEDPIEYLLGGINQIQINEKKDVTFSSCLRSILRQDPNIILVGEIRDRETADIAFRASQTGHLVLSTLHTNNSVATLTRLYDMGLEPYLISSAMLAVVAQRLVRLNCPHCIEEYNPEQQLLEKFKPLVRVSFPKKFIHGRGCEDCHFTGYFGRAAIFEVLKITLDLRQMISARTAEAQFFEKARSQGLKTLAESGFEKVLNGTTTLEELAGIVDIADEKQAEEPAARPKKIILIVDDSPLIRQMILSALANEEHEFHQAENGEQGLKAVHTLKPDLLISDVNMPIMDGFELVKKVRSSLETASTPIIMLTTLNDKESELKGINAGADDYIMKPFDAEKLKARVEMILRRSRRTA